MPLLEKQLIVRKSSIPGGGRGLFTKKLIPKGTRIVEYTGKISTWKEVDHKRGLNAYIYYVNRNHVIDASSCKKSIARYANDARGSGRINGLVNNCQYVREGDRVFIESKKDITANTEILVPYGKEYWDIIKENRAKALKKNRKIIKKP